MGTDTYCFQNLILQSPWQQAWIEPKTSKIICKCYRFDYCLVMIDYIIHGAKKFFLR